MPYTPQERRPSGNQEWKSINLETTGDLTAAIFALQLRYINEHDICFDELKNAIAAADCANDELRPIKDYYENLAEKKNGTFRLKTTIYDKITDKFRS